jgi:L-threonylcarbamoyladenylate synthase
MRLESNLDEIIELIANGEIICMPTDTLFAISCDATNHKSIEKLYQIKQRDSEKKLPVFFSSLEHVKEHCYLNEKAEALAKEFWPGKLTMVLNLKSKSSIARNAFDEGNSSIAVRIPDEGNILKIAKHTPIIGTSANISGMQNLCSYEELEKQFIGSDVTIFKPKNYQFKAGLQSTIITFNDGKVIILREGAISRNEIMQALSSSVVA